MEKGLFRNSLGQYHFGGCSVDLDLLGSDILCTLGHIMLEKRISHYTLRTTVSPRVLNVYLIGRILEALGTTFIILSGSYDHQELFGSKKEHIPQDLLVLYVYANIHDERSGHFLN